jgi:hypothetical protein
MRPFFLLRLRRGEGLDFAPKANELSVLLLNSQFALLIFNLARH